MFVSFFIRFSKSAGGGGIVKSTQFTETSSDSPLLPLTPSYPLLFPLTPPYLLLLPRCTRAGRNIHTRYSPAGFNQLIFCTPLFFTLICDVTTRCLLLWGLNMLRRDKHARTRALNKFCFLYSRLLWILFKVNKEKAQLSIKSAAASADFSCYRSFVFLF